MPNNAPRRSRKAGKMGTGAERRRLRRLEEEALRDLQSTCDLTEDAFLYRLRRSREGRVISIDLEDRINICALPNSIGQLKALTELDLFHCVSLTTLPEGFGGLTALETLILSQCVSLTKLPEGIGGLTALKTLRLSHCFALAALPDMIGELTSLTKLDLSACDKLVALPDSIGKLGALKDLNLGVCSNLTALPAAIDELKVLTRLDLEGCKSLTSLPDAIGGLTALKELNSGNCSITALPAAIGDLKALTKLDLEGCESLTSLPDTIGGLTALKELGLEGCKSLATLPPAIDTMHWLEVKGGPRSGLACFMELARPRVKAAFPDKADDAVDYTISGFWRVVRESRRAKVDGTHDGIAYGQSLVSSLIKDVKMERRRTCDACGRRGRFEEDRFPVCWCGARRYCGEECQKLDWDRGHSRTCASGYTWSATDLHWFRRFEEDRVLREQVVDDGHPSFLFDEGMVQLRQALIAKNPPPADRKR
jgi:hypothetical protein